MLEIILYVVLGCSLLFGVGAVYGLVTLEDTTKHENHRAFILILGLILIVILLAFDLKIVGVGVVAVIVMILIWFSTHDQEDEQEAIRKLKEKKKRELAEELIKRMPTKEITPEQKKEHEEFMKNLREEVRQLEKKKRQQEGSFYIWEKGYWKKR